MAFTERLALVIQVVTTRAQGELEKLGASVGNLGTRAQGAIGRLQGGLDKVGLSGSVAARSLEAVGAAGAGGVAAAGIAGVTAVVARGVSEFMDLATQVRQFKQLSGATAEDSSRFVAVLDDFGIAADTGATAVFRLARNVSSSAEGLRSFGVAVARNEDGTTNLTETVLNVADAYGNIEDPARRAALVQAAFGRGGSRLIPILEQGREGLAQFFAEAENNRQIFSDEDLAKAREYEMALDDLGDATSGLAREIGSAAVPQVASLVNGLAQAIGKVRDFRDAIDERVPDDGFVKDLMDALGKFSVSSGWQMLEEEQAKAADATEEAAAAVEEETEALDENADAAKRATTSARDHAKAKLDEKAAVLGVESAEAKLREAHDAVAEAAGAEARKAEDLADAERGVQEAIEGVEAAERALSEARKQAAKDLRDARLSAREAEEELGDAHEQAAAAAIQFGSGSEEAEDAQLASERATIRNSDAVEELARLEAEREHPRIVADAEDRLADAKRRVADAQSQVNEVLKREPVDEMRDAERQLEEAVIGVEQALLRQAEAWRNVLSTMPRTSTTPQPGPDPNYERIGARSGGSSVLWTGDVRVETNADPTRIAQEVEYQLGGRGI